MHYYLIESRAAGQARAATRRVAFAHKRPREQRDNRTETKCRSAQSAPVILLVLTINAIRAARQREREREREIPSASSAERDVLAAALDYTRAQYPSNNKI